MNCFQFYVFIIIGGKSVFFYIEYIMEVGGYWNIVVCYGRVVCIVVCIESLVKFEFFG